MFFFNWFLGKQAIQLTNWQEKYCIFIQMTYQASLIGSWYMDGKAKLTGLCYFIDNYTLVVAFLLFLGMLGWGL